MSHPSYTQSLKTTDPQLYNLIKDEHTRQANTLNLIASENYTYRTVMQASSSMLTNKYSEGTVKNRYYGGSQCIDHIESLAQTRALALFNLDPAIWAVNVQPYSGSSANFAVYTALASPGDRIMGLDLPHGGHLTHGYKTPTKNVSASSLYFNSSPYKLDKHALIDYNLVQAHFDQFLPHILICGYSAYSRDIDYKRMRDIADTNSAYLLADISHISALVASGLMNNPFHHCDVVTTTTHKGLRGPRAALIFHRKHIKKPGTHTHIDITDKINSAVFPMLQGGPHNHTIAAVASALAHAAHPTFKLYCKQVIMNSRALCNHLMNLGFVVLTAGTDNHMFLIDLTNKLVDPSLLEHMCDVLNININRNTIPGDTTALRPSGIRIGTYAITTREMLTEHMRDIAHIINDVVDLCRAMTTSHMTKHDFSLALDASLQTPALKDLAYRISHITRSFPIPPRFTIDLD